MTTAKEELDLNIQKEDIGKYIVIKVDDLNFKPTTAETLAIGILANPHAVRFGKAGNPDEFFVIMLKDECARDALVAYARKAAEIGLEVLGQSVQKLAERAGFMSKFRKLPD